MYDFCRITVGKQNYFTGYGIQLHELPVVVVLITKAFVQKMLHTLVQVMELQNLHVVKYGIHLVK